jgi:MSHA biogenesis protein MshL
MSGTSRSALRAALLVAALSAAPGAAVQPTRQLPPLPATQIDDRLPAKARQAFSLSFSEPQPIRDVLLLLVKDTGLSVAIDPDVAGTFTGELANVTLRQALEIVLPPLGLQYTLSDNVLRVSKRPIETRFFSVDHVATRRSSERTTSTAQPDAAGSGSGRIAGTGVTSGVTSSDATDFYEEMSRTIGPLLSADGSFTIDRKAGLLRVTDYGDRLDRVARYLELAELRVTRQVQVEATFVEIELKDVGHAGIDWAVVLQAAGDAVAPAPPRTASETGGVLSLRLNVRSLDGLLKALATQGTVNVLSSPRVAVMNNEPAIIRAAAPRIVPEGAARVEGKEGRPLHGGATPDDTSDNVMLTVTPQISADRIIQMSVAPSVGDGVRIRGADTLVRVREGETVVFDGLMHSRARRDLEKAPAGDGDPPPDKRSRRQAMPAPARKTELVILLTPTII